MTGGPGPGEITVWDAEKGICLEVIRPSFPGGEERNNIRDYELKNVEDERDGLLGRVAAESSTKAVHHTVSFFGAQPSVKDPDVQHSYAITGGPDGKVRFWDTDRLEGCRLICGASSPDEKPVYTFSQLSMDCRLLSEKPPDATVSASVVNSPPGKKVAGSSANKAAGRYETIRLASQNLMRGHLDLITDVKMLERPFGMVISADRSGMVCVWQ